MTIYLDYQATTPIAPEVRGAMAPWITDKFANPHAPNKQGREAAAMIEVARESVAKLLPKNGRVFFTSGATEAINWAMKSAGSGGIAMLDTEHAAVRDTAYWLSKKRRKITLLPIASDGVLDKKATVPKGVGLVAAMLVNNEIGVIQPIAALVRKAKSAGALMICDAVQAYGRIPIPEGPDFIAISAHKIHGPKGIGALWVRDGVEIEPLLHGGGQEGGMRSGTLSPALCVGFGTAAALAKQRMQQDANHVAALWDIAMEMKPRNWVINGSVKERYKGNLNIRGEGVDVARLLSDVRDVSFSAGSACASGSGRPSHVLKALGLSSSEANNSIRIGYGRYTTIPEFREGLRMIFEAASRQQKVRTAA
jgi:cysteine desulfurase